MSDDSADDPQIPPALAASAVQWMQVTMGCLPDAAVIRSSLIAAGFVEDPDSAPLGDLLALGDKITTAKVHGVGHSAWRKIHKGAPVLIILSTAQSDVGPITFSSTIFGGADEGDVVRVLRSLVKNAPFAGGVATDGHGNNVRRLFWEIGGVGGIAAIVVSGPPDTEARDVPRALIAFNKAA